MNTKEVMAQVSQVAQDEALRVKFQVECKTAEEVYSELKELGLTDSFEEFKAAVKEAMLKAMEVSPEELDKTMAAGDVLSNVYARDPDMEPETIEHGTPHFGAGLFI